jgi:heme oxygenase
MREVHTGSGTLSAVLKAQTRELHVWAERSGIIADLLRGRAAPRDYTLLLRNLLPVYQSLEAALDENAGSPAMGGLVRREVYRSAALESDLVSLAGGGWTAELPLLPAARSYADLIAEAGRKGDVALIGHAYVRYLGDLNGGQILKRLLANTLGLPPSSLRFYDFAGIDDPAGFAATYREAIDRIGAQMGDWSQVAEAACSAFRNSIALSDEVRRAGVARSGGDGGAAQGAH